MSETVYCLNIRNETTWLNFLSGIYFWMVAWLFTNNTENTEKQWVSTLTFPRVGKVGKIIIKRKKQVNEAEFSSLTKSAGKQLWNRHPSYCCASQCRRVQQRLIICRKETLSWCLCLLFHSENDHSLATYVCVLGCHVLCVFVLQFCFTAFCNFW